MPPSPWVHPFQVGTARAPGGSPGSEGVSRALRPPKPEVPGLGACSSPGGSARGWRAGDALPVTHGIPGRSAAAAGHPDSSRLPWPPPELRWQSEFPPVPDAGDPRGGSGVPLRGDRSRDRGQSPWEGLCPQIDLSVAWALPPLPVLQNPQRGTGSPQTAPTPSAPRALPSSDSFALCRGEEKLC